MVIFLQVFDFISLPRPKLASTFTLDPLGSFQPQMICIGSDLVFWQPQLICKFLIAQSVKVFPEKIDLA